MGKPLRDSARAIPIEIQAPVGGFRLEAPVSAGVHPRPARWHTYRPTERTA